MSKKKLYLISLVITFTCAFIPSGREGVSHIFGFPAQVLNYYKIYKFRFGFEWLGFIFNFYFFYF
ncbi:hypothetical protein V7110_24210, partial [Neobacillus drentensis]